MPGISSVLTEKTNLLKIMGERLPLLSTHDAYLLLRHSIALPKLLYCLRTAPCFLSPQLQQYDAVLKTTMCNTFNIHLSNDHSAWTQAVLPVRHGGLGIRSAVRLAPSAYLASAAASSTLVHQILPPQFSDTDLPCFQEALALWTNSCNQSPPEGITSYHQKSWDIPTILAIKENLLNSATNESSKSRLLAAFSEESGIWGLMRCRYLHWVSEWMTPPFRLLSACVLAWHFVNHIVAITVVVRSLPLLPMALVVLRAKVIITVIVL